MKHNFYKYIIPYLLFLVGFINTTYVDNIEYVVTESVTVSSPCDVWDDINLNMTPEIKALLAEGEVDVLRAHGR